MGCAGMVTNGAARAFDLAAAEEASPSQATYLVLVVTERIDARLYGTLWLHLYRDGFRRCIRGEAGLYRLPAGAFKVTTSAGPPEVHSRVQNVLNRLGLGGQVVIASCDSFCWSGLGFDDEIAVQELHGASWPET